MNFSDLIPLKRPRMNRVTLVISFIELSGCDSQDYDKNRNSYNTFLYFTLSFLGSLILPLILYIKQTDKSYSL